MPAISATAPGKVILIGEHAVVYGQPAIAVPVTQVQSRAVILACPKGKPGDVTIDAPDIQLKTRLENLSVDHPFSIAFEAVRKELHLTYFPAMRLRISSTLPIAGGMGSSASIAVAIIRALTRFLGVELPNETISALAYQVEKRQHGTPSGIDNTVITYAQPIYFIREQPYEVLPVGKDIPLIVADTGIRSSTAAVVNDLRSRWQKDPQTYDPIFAAIGSIAARAKQAICTGDLSLLGDLINENQKYLHEMSISCRELDHLVEQAIKFGALGAKLSGGGRGGNMIVLPSSIEQAEMIAIKLRENGAFRTLVTTVAQTNKEETCSSS